MVVCRVRTFGCSHNVSDSEYMEGMLAEYGYDLVRPFLLSSAVLHDVSTFNLPRHTDPDAAATTRTNHTKSPSSNATPQVPEAERDEADLWLLNSCTVKNPSEAGVVNLVQKVRGRFCCWAFFGYQKGRGGLAQYMGTCALALIDHHPPNTTPKLNSTGKGSGQGRGGVRVRPAGGPAHGGAAAGRERAGRHAAATGR